MSNEKNVVNPFVAELKGEDGYMGYFGAHRHIQRASYFVSKVTDESIDISLSDKVVLYYLIDQVGHSMNKGVKFTQSLTEIAVNLGMNDRTVSRAVKKFKEHNVVTVESLTKGASYTYTGIDVHQTFTTEVSAAVVKRMKPNPINVKAPVKPVEEFVEPTPDTDVPEWVTEAVEAPQTVRDDIEDHMHTDRHVSNVLDFDDFGDVVGFP